MPPMYPEKYTRSIFVQNIPAGFTEDSFRQMLSKFGVLIQFHMFMDPNATNNPHDSASQVGRGYAFAEFQSSEVAQAVINQLNGFDLGGIRLIMDLLSNQTEPIVNLFDQLWAATTTALPPLNKNDPRLASSVSTVGVAGVVPTSSNLPSTAPMNSIGTNMESSNFTGTHNKEDKESISNAVASLPPAQMFELMKQMKQCIEANPNEAKTLLTTNPQLAYALLQAQVVMRIVDPQVAVALLDRTDKDVIPTPIDVKKAMATNIQPTAAVTAPINLPIPTAPFPFPVIPGAPFSMPMIGSNTAAQQAAATALLQAALLSGSNMFSNSLIPPPIPQVAQFSPMQPTFPPGIHPLAPPMHAPNLDESAALLLLQLDDAQLARLPPEQIMKIRSLREQIAKTGLLPKM